MDELRAHFRVLLSFVAFPPSVRLADVSLLIDFVVSPTQVLQTYHTNAARCSRSTVCTSQERLK